MERAVISSRSWFGLFLSVLCWWMFEGVQRLREERPRTVANFDHASMDGFLCLKSSRLPDSWDYICLSDQASENHLGTNAWPSMWISALSSLAPRVLLLVYPHSSLDSFTIGPWWMCLWSKHTWKMPYLGTYPVEFYVVGRYMACDRLCTIPTKEIVVDYF